MKKPVKIILSTTLGLGVFAAGLFSQQVYTKATTDWQTNAYNQAQADLRTTSDQKTAQLSNQASTDINAKINSAISDDVKAKQDELNKLMEQYYQMKLNGLTDTPEFKSLQDQISQIQQWALDRFKSQIDQVFTTQTTTTK
jgi:hypothetical protein